MLIIKEYLTAVKLDEENKLLFAYDINIPPRAPISV